jgi:N utilization substance protein B
MALYAVELTGQEGGVALDGVWRSVLDDPDATEAAPTPEETAFAASLVDGVLGSLAELDAGIERASEHWRLTRMPIVDRNVIRLGAHEVLHRDDIPVSVSINEAIELAKRFGGAESKAFVNGILDRIASDSGKGGRRTRR